MHLRILGSAAGGGLPQWNCTCDNCGAARRGSLLPRTQDTVAVSTDGERWFLLNASPDVLRQIEATPALQPRLESNDDPRRSASPIAGVVLTSGDLDHCLGLLLLREWARLALFATPQTLEGLLERNVVFRTLARDEAQLSVHPLALDEPLPLIDPEGAESGLLVRAVALAGKVPLHLEGVVKPHPGHNVGLVIDEPATGARAVYAPGAGACDGIAAAVEGAGALLFDGTFFSEDELAVRGLPGRTARAMAHLPVGGAGGSLEALASLEVAQKIFVHINNTNPMLRPDSPERRLVDRSGWLVAHDGLEIAP